MRFSYSLFILLISLVGFSCSESTLEIDQPEMEVLPYFDLNGFIEKEIRELGTVKVIKNSRINGDEQSIEQEYTPEDWEKELAVFVEADINKATYVQSYTTEVDTKYLVHELKEGEKGRLKNMTITYGEDEVTQLTIKLKKESLFYTSTTTAALYFSARTFNLDHYSIETTQKVMFMSPNNIKISGVIRK